jgi:hypothetical protein
LDEQITVTQKGGKKEHFSEKWHIYFIYYNVGRDWNLNF